MPGHKRTAALERTAGAGPRRRLWRM
jgi:hypothetical protein